MDRCDLGELLLAESRLELVLDQPAVLLTGPGPDVGALGQPQFGVAGEGDRPSSGSIQSPRRIAAEGVQVCVGVGPEAKVRGAMWRRPSCQ